LNVGSHTVPFHDLSSFVGQQKVQYQALYNAFLQKLISALEKAGLTQREVSAYLGVAHSFLSKCETGDRRVDVVELIQLAQLYGKSPQYFISVD
jgi:DNA-binding XRE family transcriptional regulator